MGGGAQRAHPHQAPEKKETEKEKEKARNKRYLLNVIVADDNYYLVEVVVKILLGRMRSYFDVMASACF